VGLVKEIRRALDDTDRDAPFIRTAHRVGYAFDAPLVKGAPRSKVARWVVAGERSIVLSNGENLIGRDADAAVCLDYATVSRRHARLMVSDRGALLEDLGSKNGTLVGGARLTRPVSLRDGDRFVCGQVAVIYRESSSGVPTVTHVSMVGPVPRTRG
jgi:pSer/pThr/pTyr-binding forkhead associated (FHA) protein